MQWHSLTDILVLFLALGKCTWMKFSALAVRLISRTVSEALPSTVIITTRMQEYDVKVGGNYKNAVTFEQNIEQL